jgi:hypothetical protein
MKLDMDPFPVNMVELELKKILVCTDQAETTKGKNAIVSDDLRNQMIKLHNPKVGEWKENMQRKLANKVKPTSAMLIEKYQHQQEEDRRYRVTRGIKRDRFFEVQNRSDRQETQRAWESQRKRMQHTMDQAPGIRQITWFVDRLGLSNPDRRVTRADELHGGNASSSRKQEQTEVHAMMVCSWACKVSSEVHINGRCISDPVHEDKGKAVATGQDDEKDPKRAHVVLSQGHEVVGPGYSKLSSAAAMETDKVRCSDNLNRVTRVGDWGGRPGNPNRVIQVNSWEQ